MPDDSSKEPQRPVKCWPWMLAELGASIVAIVALMHVSAKIPSWDDHIRGLMAACLEFGVSTASTLLCRYTKLSRWPVLLVEALVTCLLLVAFMRFSANDPSLDDTLRGLGAAAIGYLFSLVTTWRLGRR